MRNLAVMVQFMHRDIKMYKQRFLRYFINDALIRPLLYSMIFAYIFPRVTVQTVNPGVAYVGSLLYLLTPLLFGLNIDYLLDIGSEKSILYKLTILPIHYFLLGRILLTAGIATIAVLGAFPLAYLIVGGDLGIQAARILPLCIIALVSALCVSTIILCFMSGMKGVHHSNWFWRRFVYPVVMFGGFLAPWYIMAKASLVFGYFILLNPLLYVTEGMRSALFEGPYIHWHYCIGALSIYSLLFFYGACWLLRRNIDSV